MKRILIAGVLAGIAMFVWESVAHMVLPLGEMGISSLPNDEAVRTALAGQLGHADGLYFYPAMQMGQEPAPGPWGLLLYHPQWTFSWAVLGWEALTEIIQGVVLALIVGMAAAGSFGRRLGIAVLVGIAAAFCVSPSYTIWYGFPLAYTAGQMIVALGDYVVGGALIAWLLKPQGAQA